MDKLLIVLGIVVAFYLVRNMMYAQSKSSAAKMGLNNLSNGEFKEKIASNEYTLFDVRSDAEVNAGYIPGAIHHAHTKFPQAAKELTKDTKILLYCAGGVRSAVAGNALIKDGFTDVSHLANGYKAWDGKITK